MIPSLKLPPMPVGIQADYLAERHYWLIKLRWYAIVGVFLALILSSTLGRLTAPTELFLTGGAMVIINLALTKGWDFFAESDEVSRLKLERQALALQICLDLTFLTLLLHWSGGIENPFAMLFVLHMATSSILLELRTALFFGFFAVGIFGGTVVFEALGTLPHYPLLFTETQHTPDQFWHSSWFVTGYLISFTFSLFGVILFVHEVNLKRRQAEADTWERERVAMSRERLARIGELSAGVAHTVRNPLHGALNCVDMLRSSLGNQVTNEIDETLSLMVEGLERIDNVTRRLLTFTREPSATRDWVDLNDLIKDSLKFIDTRLIEHQVEVRSQFSELPDIWLNREKLSEVLINILDNAVFACREKGDVTISTELAQPEKNAVLVEIRDSGEGLASKFMPRVFDPFFTTKDVGHGTGLGLAIARRVIEEHDGQIDFKSVLGMGTTIRILLPRDPKANHIPQS
jgi:signal transduction histidine kinase